MATISKVAVLSLSILVVVIVTLVSYAYKAVDAIWPEPVGRPVDKGW